MKTDAAPDPARRRLLACALALPCAACGTAPVASGPSAPIADHHQHLFSPALAQLLSPAASPFKPLLAADIVPLLDQAGIRRAAVLSTAYLFSAASRSVPDEYAKVRADNDWTGAQAALFPDRLRALCSVNPLKDYALAEIERCAADPRLRHGVKLHFGNSDVQLENPQHAAQVARVFAAANRHGMAIVVHLRASISRQRPYGAAQAHAFLDKLLPMAPDVTVQVAHLAGSGPGYDDPPAQEVMAVLSDAVLRDRPHTRKLLFDMATVVLADLAPAPAQELTLRMRHAGVDRILFGSDAAVGATLRPREAWAALARLPLTRAEVDRIARNVAPYLR